MPATGPSEPRVGARQQPTKCSSILGGDHLDRRIRSVSHQRQDPLRDRIVTDLPALGHDCPFRPEHIRGIDRKHLG